MIEFENPNITFIGVGNVTTDQLVPSIRILEAAARNCYKSNRCDTLQQAKSFLANISQKGHTSILEHIQATYKIPAKDFKDVWDLLTRMNRYKWFDINFNHNYVFLSGNVRTFYETILLFTENNVHNINETLYNIFSHFTLDLFDFLFDESIRLNFTGNYTDYFVDNLNEIPKELYRLIFYVRIDRATSMEWNRHRTLSISQESQRYVKYDSNGFRFMYIDEFANSEVIDHKITTFAKYAADLYTDLRTNYKPEIARAVLPNFTMSSVYYSGLIPYWQHFIKLRDASNAHPHIQYFAKEVRKHIEQILK